MSINPAGWNEYDSATNATATATRAAAAGKNHVIYSASGSFSGSIATPVLMQIKDGSTVIWEDYIYDAKVMMPIFPRGLRITEGAACSAVLAAGGIGIVGKVNLHGATV